MTCDLFIVSAYLVIIRPIMFTVEQWGVDKGGGGKKGVKDPAPLQWKFKIFTEKPWFIKVLTLMFKMA